MDVERIIIIHPNRMLGECMAAAIRGRVASKTTPVCSVCDRECRVEAYTYLDPSIAAQIPTVYILDSEITANPVSEITLKDLKKRATNRFIQLLGHKTSYSESSTELKSDFICFISEEDDIDSVESAIVKATQNSIFVSPSRLKNASKEIPVKLTRREHECCTYILYNIDDVSHILGINKNTIRTYYERVRDKLELENHQLLIAWSVINGIAYIPLDKEKKIVGMSA